MGSRIIGVGSALPEMIVTNDDLSQYVETDDEWITSRTGIRERHIALDETTTSLGVDAARRALGIEAGGWCANSTPLDPESLDLIIAMTVSPDMIVPSQAALYKAELGATHAVAYDLNAACAGCVYGMDTAASLLELSAVTSTLEHAAAGYASSLHLAKRNTYKRALIIGADRMSRVTDWTDRATCVLFGDGAGAVVLEWQDNDCGVLASRLVNIDDVKHALNLANTFDLSTFPFANPVKAAGERSVAALTINNGTVASVVTDAVANTLSHAGSQEAGADIPDACRDEYCACTDEYEGAIQPTITMKGAAVFKFSTKVMASCVREVLERADMDIDDIDLVVPHQANERIIVSAMKKLGLPLDIIHLTIDTVGNTSASSALIALADAYTKGKITPGSIVCMVGFGGGLTAGAVLFRA